MLAPPFLNFAGVWSRDIFLDTYHHPHLEYSILLTIVELYLVLRKAKLIFSFLEKVDNNTSFYLFPYTEKSWELKYLLYNMTDPTFIFWKQSICSRL